MKRVITPLYTFLEKWLKICCDVGIVGPAPPPHLWKELLPALQTHFVLVKWGVGARAGGFLELHNLPTQLASQSHLGCALPSSLTPSVSHRVSSWRGAEGKKWAGVSAATLGASDPGTKALAPGLQVGGGEEWPPGHGMTFRGPQRRAPGPSLPRTALPSAPWPWRGLNFCPPSLLGP